MDDPIRTAKDGIALVGEIIKAAGDNPNIREAGSNLGQTALTITKTINNALLPLASVNFAFDKARAYFAEKFLQDLSKKASAIPPEQIVDPKASIAGPALQGLAFTHEEPNLKDMYLSLLVTAMDGRVAVDAHPAFVEIIKSSGSDFYRQFIVRVSYRQGQTFTSRLSSALFHSVKLRDIRMIGFALGKPAGSESPNPGSARLDNNKGGQGLERLNYKG